jgi:two-component system, cell cycle sensor histidine kinase and response regulator CckA
LVVVVDVSGRTYQEQRLAIALGGAKLGIWEYDITSGLLRWDAVYSGIYGYDEAMLPQTPDQFLEYVDSEMRPDVRAAFFQCVEQGVDYEVEFKVLLPNRSQRWRYAYGKRVTDLAGTPVKVIGIGMDTTERKRMEQEFAQNQKFEAVGRLAGGIAHDFNNLLTVVIGHSELISGETDLKLIRESADQIQRAASRATNLVRQLLEFSRTRPQRPTAICLNEVIADTLTLVRKLLPSSITISASLDPTVPAVLADQGQIEQVVMNLCLNARDAISDVGGIQVKTYREVTSEQTPMLVLEVSDNGTGIDEKSVDLIFDPFFTTKSVDKGTGLGLSIVQSVIKQIGGTIEVKTQAGAGSTFRIRVPGVNAEIAEDSQR